MKKASLLRSALVATAVVCFGALSAQAAGACCAAPLSATAPSSPADSYPLTTCVVSGEALGSMGDTYVYIHKEDGKPDREVRLCCKGCLKKFTKEPAKYLAKLDAPVPAPAAPKADTNDGHAH